MGNDKSCARCRFRIQITWKFLYLFSATLIALTLGARGHHASHLAVTYEESGKSSGCIRTNGGPRNKVKSLKADKFRLLKFHLYKWLFNFVHWIIYVIKYSGIQTIPAPDVVRWKSAKYTRKVFGRLLRNGFERKMIVNKISWYVRTAKYIDYRFSAQVIIYWMI